MKGVSTLVAAVLLIAITLVITIIVSTTVSNLVKTEASSVQTKVSAFVNCSGSDVDIQAVYLDPGSNVVRVTVRNSGQQRENIVAGQMFNRTGGTGAAITSFPVSLARGGSTDVLFNATANVSCASFSQVVLTTECTFDFWDKAPKNC